MKPFRATLIAILVLASAFSTAAWAQCASNDDCKQGRVCYQGQCTAPSNRCSVDRDCPGDAICDGGMCHGARPRMREPSLLTWQANLFGTVQFVDGGAVLGYGGMFAAGVRLSSYASLLAEAQLTLSDGAYVRQILLGPSLRIQRWGAMNGNFTVGAVFMRQPEITGDDSYYSGLGIALSSWYEIAGPLAFIYGAEFAIPLGVDRNAYFSPQPVYGLVLGLGWVDL